MFLTRLFSRGFVVVLTACAAPGIEWPQACVDVPDLLMVTSFATTAEPRAPLPVWAPLPDELAGMYATFVVDPANPDRSRLVHTTPRIDLVPRALARYRKGAALVEVAGQVSELEFATGLMSPVISLRSDLHLVHIGSDQAFFFGADRPNDRKSLYSWRLDGTNAARDLRPDARLARPVGVTTDGFWFVDENGSSVLCIDSHGSIAHRLVVEGQVDLLHAAYAFSPDGRYIAVCALDGKASDSALTVAVSETVGGTTLYRSVYCPGVAMPRNTAGVASREMKLMWSSERCLVVSTPMFDGSDSAKLQNAIVASDGIQLDVFVHRDNPVRPHVEEQFVGDYFVWAPNRIAFRSSGQVAADGVFSADFYLDLSPSGRWIAAITIPKDSADGECLVMADGLAMKTWAFDWGRLHHCSWMPCRARALPRVLTTTVSGLAVR